MATPSFYSEGNSPLPQDTEHRTAVKILGAIIDNGGTGGGSGAGGYVGSGSPEGVVTADAGSPYTDTTGHSLWIKETGSGNTGWVQYIA